MTGLEFSILISAIYFAAAGITKKWTGALVALGVAWYLAGMIVVYAS